MCGPAAEGVGRRLLGTTFEDLVLLLVLQLLRSGWAAAHCTAAFPYDSDLCGRRGLSGQSFTIFEGTSEIQHLVIARAISGMQIK